MSIDVEKRISSGFQWGSVLCVGVWEMEKGGRRAIARICNGSVCLSEVFTEYLSFCQSFG